MKSPFPLRILIFLLISNFNNTINILAQDRFGKEDIVEERNEILDKYYYAEFDSARILLRQLSKKAKKMGYLDEYLNTILELAWVSEQHTQIDSLHYFIALGENEFGKMDSAKVDPDGIILANYLYAKGMYHYHMGNSAKSVDVFLELVRSLEGKAVADSLLLFDTYSNIISGYYAQEKYLTSISYNEIARNWISKPGNDADKKEAYNYQIAYLKTLSGRSLIAESKRNPATNDFASAALSEYLEAYRLLEYSSEKKQKNLKRTIFNNLAKTYMLVSKPDSALYYFEKALDLYSPEDINNRKTLTNLGEYYLETGNYGEALIAFNKSLALTRENFQKSHLEIAILNYKIGEVLNAKGEWDMALNYIQESIAIISGKPEFANPKNLYTQPELNQISADKEFLEAIYLKASNFYGQFLESKEPKFLELAQQHFDLALNQIDKQRFNNSSSDYKQYLSSKSLSIYESAIEAAFESYNLNPEDHKHLKKAFFYTEKSKNLTLLEAVNEVEAKKFAGVPDSLLEIEMTYKGKIAFLKKEIDRRRNKLSKVDDEILSEFLESQNQLEDFVKKLEVQYPEYYHLKYDLEVIDIHQIATQEIRPGDLLIEYFFGDKYLYIFGISDHQILLQRTANNESLQKDLHFFIENLAQFNIEKGNRSFEEFTQKSHHLHQKLLDPVLSQLDETKIKSINIVPDGSLGYIPFEVLLTQLPTQGNIDNYQELSYLIKQYPVSYAFSSTLKYIKKKPFNTKPKAWDYIGFAPDYNQNLLASVSHPSVSRKGFSVLMNNQPEIKNAAELFNGKTYLGDLATKEAFRADAENAGILHLSLHAFANDQIPALSGLVFSNNSTVKNEGNDILYAYELFNMNINAELAILSGCETGVGRLARGEGIISLGRAFKYAGCQEITMSLWKANDKTTAQIMEHYCKNIKEGMDKGQALQQAKLTFLGNAVPMQQHPFYWSTFIFIGDDVPMLSNLKSGNFYKWILAGLISLSLIIFMVWSQKNRTHSSIKKLN